MPNQSKFEKSEAIARRLFEAYEAKDYDALMEIYSTDAVIELPFNPSGKTADGDIRRIKGVAELEAFLVPGIASMKSIRFDIEDISTTNDGARVFVESRGDFITSKGTPYRNRYVFRLDIQGERVTRQKEYFNVATVQARDLLDSTVSRDESEVA